MPAVILQAAVRPQEPMIVLWGITEVPWPLPTHWTSKEPPVTSCKARLENS